MLRIVSRALPAGEFDLEIATDLHPEQNTSLEGLYKSGGNFCTQVGFLSCPCWLVVALAPAAAPVSLGGRHKSGGNFCTQLCAGRIARCR